MSEPPHRASPDQRRQQEPGVLVGRFFGVPVYFAPSWLLIAGIITVTYAGLVERTVDNITTVASYAVAFGFAVLLALSLLAHELGHTAVSIALGMPVRRVVIFLLGGVSEITSEPRRPGEEYLVAVAGPLVSLFLAGVGAALAPLTSPRSVARVLVLLLAGGNLLVMIFNMLPGLPLDGGRVLRAGVWRMAGDRLAGTRAAAWCGRGVAILVVVLALATAEREMGITFGNIAIAALLAGFIWVGANQSLAAATINSRLPALRVAHMARPALEVPANLPVAEALRRAWETRMRALLVVDGDGRPLALVSEAQVRDLPEQRRPWTTVSEVSRPIEPGLTLLDTLAGKDVLEALQRTPASEYLVVRSDGATVGVLAATDVANLLRYGPPRPANTTAEKPAR